MNNDMYKILYNSNGVQSTKLTKINTVYFLKQ